MASIHTPPLRKGSRLGNLLRDLGDWCFARGWNWPTDPLYAAARKLGADMEWPGRKP